MLCWDQADCPGVHHQEQHNRRATDNRPNRAQPRPGATIRTVERGPTRPRNTHRPAIPVATRSSLCVRVAPIASDPIALRPARGLNRQGYAPIAPREGATRPQRSPNDREAAARAPPRRPARRRQVAVPRNTRSRFSINGTQTMNILPPALVLKGESGVRLVLSRIGSAQYRPRSRCCLGRQPAVWAWRAIRSAISSACRPVRQPDAGRRAGCATLARAAVDHGAMRRPSCDGLTSRCRARRPSRRGLDLVTR